MRFDELLALPGVTETMRLGSSVGFMAFHGGNLERTTDEIAEAAAQRTGASLYTVTQEHPLREHIPSMSVKGTESVALAVFLAHVDVVFAVHGYGREGLWSSILLGGSNRQLASMLGGAIRKRLPEFVAVDAAEDIPADLRGLHPDNPVNVARLGGVQIELPPRVRGLTPHAAKFERRDGRIPWTNSLIDALVDAAHEWEGLSSSLRD